MGLNAYTKSGVFGLNRSYELVKAGYIILDWVSVS